MQNTVILCHFVSLLGMLCHLGGWGKGCRHMISTTQNLPKPDKTPGIIDKSGVGAVGQTSSKDSDCASHNLFFMGVAPYWVLSVNLICGRIVKERHEKYEQPTAQLVGTSWD